MNVLSLEEFKEKSVAGVNSLEKIYQEKTIIAGPVFSLTNVKAAKQYCHKFTKEAGGAICIIVEEKSFFRIWSENLQYQQKSLKKQTKKVTANSLGIEAEFVAICQKLLAEYIGPVAPVVCKKTLAKKANLTREQFVEILAKKISDPQQAKEFQQAVLK